MVYFIADFRPDGYQFSEIGDRLFQRIPHPLETDGLEAHFVGGGCGMRQALCQRFQACEHGSEFPEFRDGHGEEGAIGQGKDALTIMENNPALEATFKLA